MHRRVYAPSKPSQEASRPAQLWTVTGGLSRAALGNSSWTQFLQPTPRWSSKELSEGFLWGRWSCTQWFYAAVTAPQVESMSIFILQMKLFTRLQVVPILALWPLTADQCVKRLPLNVTVKIYLVIKMKYLHFTWKVEKNESMIEIFQFVFKNVEIYSMFLNRNWFFHKHSQFTIFYSQL